MASSSYWYDRYKEKRDLVKDYEKQIKELNTILGNLQNNLYDEIQAVNNKTDDLKEDLAKAVRHNVKFTASKDSLGSKKEKAATADQYLARCAEAVEDEISSLSSRKSTAIYDRDEYYRKYETAKEEERQAWLDSLFGKRE